MATTINLLPADLTFKFNRRTPFNQTFQYKVSDTAYDITGYTAYAKITNPNDETFTTLEYDSGVYSSQGIMITDAANGIVKINLLNTTLPNSKSSYECEVWVAQSASDSITFATFTMMVEPHL